MPWLVICATPFTRDIPGLWVESIMITFYMESISTIEYNEITICFEHCSGWSRVLLVHVHCFVVVLRYFQKTRNKSILDFRWGTWQGQLKLLITRFQLSTGLHGCFPWEEQQSETIHVFAALSECHDASDKQWSTIFNKSSLSYLQDKYVL